MKQYDPQTIEPKWQKIWADTGVYTAVTGDATRPKYYMLTEFPYPSAAGLHAGHVREYTIGDVMARHKRMLGYNVLYPMGWDAFGLPTENYAIKTGQKPQDVTDANTAIFRRQMQALGLSFDWSREVNTSDPAYYKWTQWLFLQFFKHGLAYQAEMPINWCPFEKTGLANEEVVNGLHERCGTPVEKKLLKQWMLKITAYADRLVDGLKSVDYPPRIADQQINWIGRSEGAKIDFEVAGEKITVYTTRPDTLAGATFLVLAPEHPAVSKITEPKQKAAVEQYVKETQSETDLNRQEEDRPKTGVFTGAYAENPITHEKMPVWIADYVLAGYGTGAIMAVPAHDDRDFAFAKAFNLPVINVIDPVMVRDDARDLKEYKRHHKIVAVVENDNGEVLTINWGPKYGGRLTIGGTIEDNEAPETTALREVAEETGYHDVEVLATGAETMHYKYFAFSKQEGHDVTVKFVHLRLKSDQRRDQQLDESEKKKFTVEWVSRDQAERDITEPLHRYAVEKFLTGRVYTGDGVLVNSGQFDGLTTAEAKRAIVQWLFDHGLGRHATTYRLRDWIFSRQHYWGEPIPIVHCPHCAARSAKPKLSLSFYDQPTWDAILAQVKTVESRALNPAEPGRFFGDIRPGDVLELVNKPTGEKVAVEVAAAKQFASVEEFHGDNDWIEGVSETGVRKSLEQQRSAFGSYAPDYLGRIKNHGLIAWKIHLLTEAVPVPDDQLPVKLPEVEHYEPTGTGESPLAAIPEFVNTACPQCGGPARRETDTMPNWAGSSWYWLRYMDPHNEHEFAARAALDYWGMVDIYLGGMEHTTLHLLYSRFWHQFFYDQGLVPLGEPYAARRGQGIVLAADGRKMSKSLGNVVNPTDIVARYGADTFRLYIMFMAPYDETTPWSDERLNGVSRFLYRVWALVQQLREPRPAAGLPGGITETAADRVTHKTLKKVHDDLAGMRFNTYVSTLMEYVNYLNSPDNLAQIRNLPDLAGRTIRTLILMLAPAAPHLAEELWHELGEQGSVHTAPWPAYNPALIKDDLVTIVVQVNGKVRGQIAAPADASEADLINLATAEPKVAARLEGKKIANTVVVPRRLVNFVAK